MILVQSPFLNLLISSQVKAVRIIVTLSRETLRQYFISPAPPQTPSIDHLGDLEDHNHHCESRNQHSHIQKLRSLEEQLGNKCFIRRKNLAVSRD